MLERHDGALNTYRSKSVVFAKIFQVASYKLKVASGSPQGQPTCNFQPATCNSPLHGMLGSGYAGLSLWRPTGKTTSWVTTGAPCIAAAENPTTMNRTRDVRSAVRRRTSLSAKGSGAATDEAPLQAFERGLFQQDQGVANIAPIGSQINRQDLFDAGRQPKRPASGLSGACC